MKNIIRLFAVLLLLTAPTGAYAQTGGTGEIGVQPSPFVLSWPATTGSHLPSAGKNVDGTGYQYYQAVWTGSGTRTSCAGTIDKSDDNITWSTAITITDCTTNSASSLTNFITRYVRINPSTMTGNKNSITISLFGYATAVSVSGSVTANAGTNLNTSLLALESAGNLEGVNSHTAALGSTTDAKSTATDITAASIVSVLKEVSYWTQALGALISGSGFGVNITGGVTADGAYGAAMTNPPVPVTFPLASSTTTAGSPYVGAAHDLYTSNPNDPCNYLAKTVLPINQTTSAVKIISLSGTTSTYICSVFMISATAQNINLVAGTKASTECDTSTAGLFGGTTAATGPNLAANTGWTLGSGGYTVAKAGAGLDVCYLSSSTGQVSGVITYVQK